MPISRLKHRPLRRRGAALAAVGALGFVLTGCVGSPSPTQTPTPTEAAPVFASDEEALAAAESAYERYQAMSSDATSTGEVPPDAESIAVGDALALVKEAVQKLSAEGLQTVGTPAFSTHELQSIDFEQGRGSIVAFYVCDDLRGVDVVDQSGASAVRPDRVEDVPYLVVAEGPGEALVISTKELWERENFCL